MPKIQMKIVCAQTQEKSASETRKAMVHQAAEKDAPNIATAAGSLLSF